MGPVIFKNLDVNEMIFLFNRTIEIILSNYIPHEIIICEDRDSPWVNIRVEELIRKMISSKVIFIVLRIPNYSIKTNVFKMNLSL